MKATFINLVSFLEASKSHEIFESFKKINAQFIENKMKAERAEALLGSDWMKIIKFSTTQIKKEFECRPIIIKKGYKKSGTFSK